VALPRDTGGATCQVSYWRHVASYVIRKGCMLDRTSTGIAPFVYEAENVLHDLGAENR
jgi:hypothetical protein